MKIAVYRNGVREGYVKSINYSLGRFSKTTNMRNAKNSYRSQSELMYDIDYLTKVTFGSGYIFMME